MKLSRLSKFKGTIWDVSSLTTLLLHILISIEFDGCGVYRIGGDLVVWIFFWGWKNFALVGYYY